MPLDDTDAPAPPPGFALDSASPLLRTKTDDIPTITVRPQGQKPVNAGNEGGGPAPPAGFKLDSQPHVEGTASRSSSRASIWLFVLAASTRQGADRGGCRKAVRRSATSRAFRRLDRISLE